MKFIVQFLLIVFVTFLSTPTIVSVIKKSKDTSYFYAMSEEEHAHKEIKVECSVEEPLTLCIFPLPTSSLIPSKNVAKHDAIASTIFIPPPEQV